MLSGERMVGLSLLGGPGMTRLSTDDLTAFLSLGEAAAIVVENSQEYENDESETAWLKSGRWQPAWPMKFETHWEPSKALLSLDPDELPAESQEFVDVIIEEVDRLGNVVGQFLNYARPYHGDPVPTDINQVISQTVKLFTHAKLSPDLMIVQDLTHDLPLVELDPEQLKQVLFNLMRTQRVGAMPESGDLTIKTTIDHAPAFGSGSQDRSHGLENANLQIKVIDTGVGIPADQLKRIFLPFLPRKQTLLDSDLPSVSEWWRTRAVDWKSVPKSASAQPSRFGSRSPKRPQQPEGRLTSFGFYMRRILSVLALFTLCSCIAPAGIRYLDLPLEKDGALHVVNFDVGQADATPILYNGKTILFDCGSPNHAPRGRRSTYSKATRCPRGQATHRLLRHYPLPPGSPGQPR